MRARHPYGVRERWRLHRLAHCDEVERDAPPKVRGHLFERSHRIHRVREQLPATVEQVPRDLHPLPWEVLVNKDRVHVAEALDRCDLRSLDVQLDERRTADAKVAQRNRRDWNAGRSDMTERALPGEQQLLARNPVNGGVVDLTAIIAAKERDQPRVRLDGDAIGQPEFLVADRPVADVRAAIDEDPTLAEPGEDPLDVRLVWLPGVKVAAPISV